MPVLHEDRASSHRIRHAGHAQRPIDPHALAGRERADERGFVGRGHRRDDDAVTGLEPVREAPRLVHAVGPGRADVGFAGRSVRKQSHRARERSGRLDRASHGRVGGQLSRRRSSVVPRCDRPRLTGVDLGDRDGLRRRLADPHRPVARDREHRAERGRGLDQIAVQRERMDRPAEPEIAVHRDEGAVILRDVAGPFGLAELVVRERHAERRALGRVDPQHVGPHGDAAVDVRGQRHARGEHAHVRAPGGRSLRGWRHEQRPQERRYDQ